MNKLEALKKLRDELNVEINGLENLNSDSPNVFIANHNCLKDIFYLPMSLPMETVSLISSRLIYKPDKKRQEMVEKYLYAMPIEAHGGSRYSEICLSRVQNILKNNISLSIFPEGAYVEENIIYRERTGASRIVYSSRDNGIAVNLVPVALDININDLDNYDLIPDDMIKITIMEPINYEQAYYDYINSTTIEEKRYNLHRPIDEGMSKIAKVLGRKYVNDYIILRPKNNVIFPNGEVVSTDQAQKDEFTSFYDNSLLEREKMLVNTLRIK